MVIFLRLIFSLNKFKISFICKTSVINTIDTSHEDLIVILKMVLIKYSNKMINF